MGLHEIKRDLAFATGVLLRRPFQCLIQVTNRCNMTCPFCDFWPNGVRADQELSVADYERLEPQLTELGRFLISIEGGEPFVRPDLVDIVRVFAARHVATLYTNGWFVDDDAARRLFDAGLAQVGVSIDFADPARHDSNRGLAGAAARAWQAVERFRDAAPHGGKQVHVMTVFMRDNVDELERLLELSAARGVGHCITLLSVNGFRRGTRGGEWPLPCVSQRLVQLWHRYPHFRVFRDYLELMDPFLATTTASFNRKPQASASDQRADAHDAVGPANAGAQGTHACGLRLNEDTVPVDQAADNRTHRSMPRCRAGLQSFNIDHVGNVSPCIEKIDQVVGNVRRDPLAAIHARLVQQDAGAGCQDCWTLCRGFGQLMGAGGDRRSWWDLATRMRSA